MDIIKINTNIGNKEEYYLQPIYDSLKLVSNKFKFKVEKDKRLIPCTISFNGKLLAYIAYADRFRFSNKDLKILSKKDFKIIFKYHYSPNIFDYSIYPKYKDKIIPCGLYRWWKDIDFNKELFLNKERNVDVIATMRWYNKGTPPTSKKKWVIARKAIINEAEKLKQEGYKTFYGKVLPINTYKKILLDTKIGFIWSASAYLGWKIPEFIQTGVVMITEPLGKDCPLINNTILEHEKHCIFESNPYNFGKVAKKLLSYPKKLKEMRKNVLNLWENKLYPEKVGEYYYKKLKETYEII